MKEMNGGLSPAAVARYKALTSGYITRTNVLHGAGGPTYADTENNPANVFGDLSLDS